MSLLWVAPYILTGMVTMPKLIDPLERALAIVCSTGKAGRRRFSTGPRRLSTGYQHKLLINNDLQDRLLVVREWACCGLSHTALASASSAFRPGQECRRWS